MIPEFVTNSSGGKDAFVTVSNIYCRNNIINPCKCLFRNLCKFRQKICETFVIKMRQFLE